MSSVGNPNPFAPYENYRDCSQGICSIYCPQFCYLIFPPPPPSGDDSGAPFSPLIIAIIGVLASAFLLVSYYTVVTRYCKRRASHGGGADPSENRDESSPDQWQVAQTGLDDAIIKTITVCKYKKGEALIEGTDCAVCLSEFQENESLRLLPKCSHAFHIPCIDTWLRSQSNCPLCRANVVALAHEPSVVSSYEVQRPDDLVLVVEDQESGCHEHMVVVDDGGGDRNQETGVDDQWRRSVSLGAFSSHLLVSDILKFEEIDEFTQLEKNHVRRGIGCSSPLTMKRSVSSDGFMFKVNDKGKKSMVSSLG